MFNDSDTDDNDERSNDGGESLSKSMNISEITYFSKSQ